MPGEGRASPSVGVARKRIRQSVMKAWRIYLGRCERPPCRDVPRRTGYIKPPHGSTADSPSAIAEGTGSNFQVALDGVGFARKPKRLFPALIVNHNPSSRLAIRTGQILPVCSSDIPMDQRESRLDLDQAVTSLAPFRSASLAAGRRCSSLSLIAFS